MFWWIVAAAAAYFVKGLCGFANTLVFTSILSFTSDNVLITPTEILLSYPTNFIVLFKERKNIKLNVFLPLSAWCFSDVFRVYFSLRMQTPAL